MYSNVIYNAIVIIYILSLHQVLGQNNQCPDIFEYDFDEDRWYGFITIPNPGYGTTKLTAKVSTRGHIQRGNGGLTLYKQWDDVVDDLRRGHDIQYVLTFSGRMGKPRLTSLTLNDDENRDLCSERSSYYHQPSWVFSESFTFPVEEDTRQISSTPPRPTPTIGRISQSSNNAGNWMTQIASSNQCGKRNGSPDSVKHRVIGGWGILPHEYPWMVALFRIAEKEGNQYRQYICGGSLISTRYVLTAAHCTTDLDRVIMDFGRYNITDITEQYTARLVEKRKMIEHPDYKPNTGHADIALLEIDPISYEQKIRPICLWPFGSDLDELKGTITGWGRVENGGLMATTPMQLIVKVVSQEECQNVEQLARITSSQTFCAGGQNKGPCHGDSGSGFYVHRDGRWYLRGIISTSLGSSLGCNLNYYAVYADVSQYLDWLQQYLI